MHHVNADVSAVLTLGLRAVILQSRGLTGSRGSGDSVPHRDSRVVRRCLRSPLLESVVCG